MFNIVRGLWHNIRLSAKSFCSPLHPGGPAADPGEAWAQPGGPEEAGGDQGVLAGSGEHHSGQSSTPVWGQQGWSAGAELRKPGPETGPAGGSTGLRRSGTGPHHCQQAAQKTTGLYSLKTK